MDKSSATNAIIDLMQEARNERVSIASIRRTVRACKALGVEGRELWRILSWLDIANQETGDPYSKSIERFW